MEFVRETSFLNEAVQRAARPEVDIPERVRACRSRRSRLDGPPKGNHELGYYHDVLDYLASLEDDDLSGLIVFYTGSTSASEAVRRFSGDTIKPYAENIGFVLREAMLPLQQGEGSAHVQVTASEGSSSQVVVNQGSGSVVATQRHAQAADAVVSAATALLEAIGGIQDAPGSADLQSLEGVAKAAVKEAQRPDPNRWSLSQMKTYLVELGGTVAGAQVIHDYVPPLIQAINDLIACAT